jgi:hypothetical protein
VVDAALELWKVDFAPGVCFQLLYNLKTHYRNGWVLPRHRDMLAFEFDRLKFQPLSILREKLDGGTTKAHNRIRVGFMLTNRNWGQDTEQEQNRRSGGHASNHFFHSSIIFMKSPNR